MRAGRRKNVDGTARVTISRHTARGIPRRVADDVAIEEPLEIQVNGRAVAVLMRTPGHDLELAAGFLMSEGVVRSRDDLFDIGHCLNDSGDGENENVVGVKLSSGDRTALRRMIRRSVTGSSCGTCGKTSIDAVHLDFPPLARRTRPRAGVLARLPLALERPQVIFGATGGLHAAALFDCTGALLHLREDVGRHNAVDKILGRMLLDETATAAGAILFVSGRVSFEIMQKALAARIGVVAGISAPTSLAVEFARVSRQVLAGFVRDGRFNIYTGSAVRV